ncbi:MAG: hypothetical protein AAFR21_12560 [Pseudomonadota bacterium]
MDLAGALGTYISAGIVAAAGTAWFYFVMKGLKQLSSGQRSAVFAAIFGAYFVLTVVLINQLGL